MHKKAGIITLAAALIILILLGVSTYISPRPLYQNSELEISCDSLLNTATSTTNVTITAPTAGTVLHADKPTKVCWVVPQVIVDSVPDDFKMYVFLYVMRLDADGKAVETVGGLGDGNIVTSSSQSIAWNIPAQITNGSLTSGTFIIRAHLQLEPKDNSRSCVRSDGAGGCMSSEADIAIMSKYLKMKSETGPFIIEASDTLKDNYPPVITEVTGPTTLQLGEEGVWHLVAKDDTAKSLRYECNVSLAKEFPADRDGFPYIATVSSVNLPTQNAAPGTSVTFTYTPATTTPGKTFYDLSCTVFEKVPGNSDFSNGRGKGLMFEVTP
ncbi:hypothetical protein K2Q00_04040 [Patescibacteria group bacterium]|nr:hypothetical protein [Patescibacteria group bacterium]